MREEMKKFCEVFTNGVNELMETLFDEINKSIQRGEHKTLSFYVKIVLAMLVYFGVVTVMIFMFLGGISLVMIYYIAKYIEGRLSSKDKDE